MFLNSNKIFAFCEQRDRMISLTTTLHIAVQVNDWYKK